MELSLRTLRSRIDPFLSELGTLLYRHGAGLSPTLPIAELYREWPELSGPESFHLVREALAKPGRPEDQVRGLRSILEFVATGAEEQRASGVSEELAALESSAQLAIAHETVPFREAVASLCLEPNRDKRELTERAVGTFLLEHQRPWALRREAAVETARALGFSGYVALRDAVSGFEAGALAEQCERVLKQTEDAFRDVLGYALKKVSPELRALPSGTARRHDLLRVAVAPWLMEHFRREDLLTSVMRCVEELGFHRYANGRIRVDSEHRATKSPRPFVAGVRIPDEVHLVLRPGQGLEDYFALLHEYGHALHFAGASRTLRVEDRRLQDASINEAWAFVFDHFLIDERWHRRYLHLSVPVAKEAARIAALNNLELLRRYCARLPYELSLYARGPKAELADEYQERLSGALFVHVHKGFFLFDVDPQLYAARYLRGWALEARLHKELQERFDDDHWRNPAAGQWMSGFFDRGGGAELAQGPLDLEAAGARLVEVLNR